MRKPTGRAPKISLLVEVQRDAFVADVDDVGSARAIDIGKMDAPGIEQVRVSKTGALLIATLARIRPVKDLTVADADNIRMTVGGDVHESKIWVFGVDIWY